MYKKEKKLFVFILLGILATILNLVLGLLFVNLGTVGIVIVVVLGVLNGGAVLFLFGYAIMSIVKHISSKEANDLGFPILNLIFSIIGIVVFLTMYVSIMVAIIAS